MTISLIIAVVIIGAVLLFIFRSGKKESHHLDKLHIDSTNSNR
jgi:hypothetical protein